MTTTGPIPPVPTLPARPGPRRWPGLLALVVVLVAAFGGASAVSALAAAPPETLYVTVGGTDPTCTTPAGCATIEVAIDRAYRDETYGRASSVTIEIGPGTYDERPSVFGGIPSLALVGSGVGVTTIDGSQAGSVLTVAAGDTVNVSQLTITQGVAPQGGGIYNDGSLTLDHVSVSFNAASGPASENEGFGGGVYSGGNLTATFSSFLGNQASNFGGAVAEVASSGSSDSLTDDAIVGNAVLDGTSGTGGAGVWALGGVGTTFAFAADTIANNDVLGTGGAGGGVLLDDATGAFTGDTIAGSQASLGGGIGDEGGTQAISSTILARNEGGNCAVAVPPGGTVLDGGYNLEDDPGDSCGLADFGKDPGLGTLAGNGGPTSTEAITSLSPAYDAIPASSPLCAGTDQRGVSRIQRGAGACDIGAYQVDAPTLYVANPGGQSVTAYATGASGNAAPVLTLAGSDTGLNQPRGVVVDVTGKVYVANSAADSVTEYAPELTGNVAPAVTLAGARTKLSSPQGLALDSSGDLWVSNGKGSVLEFAPGAGGNAKPLTVISGSATGLHDPQGLNFDSAGVLHVSNSNGRVTAYVSGAHGDAAPQQRIGAGSLSQPEGLNFDGAGDMLVADAGKDQIDEFSATATASSSPTATIAGMGTGLNAPVGLDLDTANNLFVANSAGNSVTEYPPGASGAQSPMATIFGPATGLNDPAFLSELPPAPVPRVRVGLVRRIAIKKLLHERRLVIGLSASGRLAFHSGSLRVTVTARLGGRELAVVRTTFLVAGHRTVALVLTPRAREALRHTRAKLIAITVALRDGAGTQRKHLTVRLRR